MCRVRSLAEKKLKKFRLELETALAPLNEG